MKQLKEFWKNSGTDSKISVLSLLAMCIPLMIGIFLPPESANDVVGVGCIIGAIGLTLLCTNEFYPMFKKESN